MGWLMLTGVGTDLWTNSDVTAQPALLKVKVAVQVAVYSRAWFVAWKVMNTKTAYCSGRRKLER